MNHESLNRGNKHVTDALRIKTQFENISTEEVDILIKDKVQNLSARWTLCRKSFRMLFMALNRGNGHNLPQDSFDIRVGHEMIGDTTFDTYVRLHRERKSGAFIIRPFTRTDGIESHEYEPERFEDTFTYRYGTHRSKTAQLSIDHDTPDPTLRLERLQGYLVSDMNDTAKSAFVAGMINAVAPIIDRTEESLIFLTSSVMDPELNPDHAGKFRLPVRE
jgi:hypothetical protein